MNSDVQVRRRRLRSRVVILGILAVALLLAVTTPWLTGRYGDYQGFWTAQDYGKDFSDRVGSKMYSTESPCQSSSGDGEVELHLAARTKDESDRAMTTVLSALRADGWSIEQADEQPHEIYEGRMTLDGQPANVLVERAGVRASDAVRVWFFGGRADHCLFGLL